MTRRHVDVEAASRLHFGLFSFGHGDMPQFGGAGLMISRPALRLSIESADRFELNGPHAAEIRAVVDRLGAARWFATAPACRVTVLESPPRHVGLGSGTQLALAVAAGLARWLGREAGDCWSLATLAGRAKRSAIGAYGFAQGGLLVEGGQWGYEPAPLIARAEPPGEWRFLLARPTGELGLSGAAERAAFDRLPPVPEQTTNELYPLALAGLVAGAQAGNFARFSEALFEYGARAGQCFAAVQGGTYATPRVAQLVERIRAQGVVGVAQSSWGPTIAAVCQNAAQAEALQTALLADLGETIDMVVAAAANTGAQVVDRSPEQPTAVDHHD